MKKFTYAMLAALLVCMSASAQDIITKKNGEDIKAKIVEITETTVRYRAFANLEGPIYNLSKTEVFMIKYQNGEKDVFGADAPQPQSDAPAQEYGEVKSLVKETAKPIRDKDIEFGVNGMFGWTAVAVEGADKNPAGPSFGAGGFMNYFLSPTSPGFVRMALGYTHSQFKQSYEIMGITTKSNTRADMLNIDLGFGVRKPDRAFFVHIGLATALLMSVKDKTTINGTQGEDKDVMDGCNVFQAGLYAFMGWSFGNFETGVNARMLSNFNKKSETNDTSTPSASIGLSLGYRF